jgi:hypothetical protein
MPALDPPPSTHKAGDALILTRIWGGFMALCHLGGLVGALAPLFLRTTLSWYVFVSLAHHVVALVAAVMLLIGLRSARLVLSLVIVLSIAHGMAMFSVSALGAMVTFGFGLFLYVPPLVLIQWRPQYFR